MKSKTLSIINKHFKLIKEQDDQDSNQMTPPVDESGMEGAGEAPPSVTETEIPFTSDAENDYISAIIDAALYDPSSEQRLALSNYQSQMALKKYKNARDEILSPVLTIINPETNNKEIGNKLTTISKFKI